LTITYIDVGNPEVIVGEGNVAKLTPKITIDNVTQRENDVGPDAVFPGAGKRFGVAEG
jgi:hypothetical protein